MTEAEIRADERAQWEAAFGPVLGAAVGAPRSPDEVAGAAELIRADERAQLAARATDHERGMVEGLRAPCSKRRLHEQWKHSANTELRMAAQMCTPDQPCRDCIEWDAAKATLLAALTASRERAERMLEFVEFVQELADEDCEYRDNCPTNAGSRHGTCLRCKALAVLTAPVVADTTAPGGGR